MLIFGKFTKKSTTAILVHIGGDENNVNYFQVVLSPTKCRNKAPVKEMDSQKATKCHHHRFYTNKLLKRGLKYEIILFSFSLKKKESEKCK